MSVSCFKCGAMPGHSLPTLDVLKLFKCEDCGTIACINHRKGILGGACTECGSSRTSVAAMRKGGKGKGDGESKGSSGGASSGGGATSGGTVALAKSQLSEMQKTRQKASEDAQARMDAANKKVAEEKLSDAEKQRRKEIEEKLAEVLGSSKLVKDALPEELVTSINSKLPEGVSLASLQQSIKEDDAEGSSSAGSPKINKEEEGSKSNSKLKQATTMLASAVQGANISSQIEEIMNDESFNDGAEGLEFSSSCSIAGVSANSMVSVESIDNSEKTKKKGKSKKENSEDDKDNLLGQSLTTVSKTGKTKVTLIDAFNVKSNYRIKLEDAIELKKQAEESIVETLAEQLNIDKCSLDLTLKVKNFIPLDNIDHLLNLYANDLDKEHISIITGVLAQKLTYDTVSYLDQFAHILPQKSYIKGLYASFANNPEYSFELQKEMNLVLIDLAQENDKIMYLGLDNCEIKHWKEIFEEYDLSEVSFVYTEVIKTEEELEFIKENNISILIRPDIDFEFYAKILNDYPLYYFGSGFERFFENNTDDKVANTAILAKILKNMYNVDKNLLEKLLNLSEND